MTIVGGLPESKEIGLPISLTGTFENTEIDSSTGYLRLKAIDIDGNGGNVYSEVGSWISSVINLGDKFTDFDKVFVTELQNGSSSFAIQTRVSDNGYDWSEWTAIAMDGTIQSETKQYIQIKINLYAGFVTDVFLINKEDYANTNEFVTSDLIKVSGYTIPTLTSNTSSSLGFAFAKSVLGTSNPAWRAFDKGTTAYASLAVDINNGYVGFCYSQEIRITKYKIQTTTVPTSAPKDFFLEASNDTTTGLDGTWEILDTRSAITWVSNETKEFTVTNAKKFKAYRIRWTSNGGNTSYTGIGELDFWEDDTTHLRLKREYEFDMTLDPAWTEEGSLHRKKITRDEWLRIDKMNVLRKI